MCIDDLSRQRGKGVAYFPPMGEVVCTSPQRGKWVAPGVAHFPLSGGSGLHFPPAGEVGFPPNGDDKCAPRWRDYSSARSASPCLLRPATSTSRYVRCALLPQAEARGGREVAR